MPFRRRTLPDTVRRAAPIRPGDRVLASAELTDGAWVLAARGSLVVVEGRTVRLNRPWHEVDRAVFDPQSATVTVTWVDDAEPLVAQLADTKRLNLARTIRERVESSVILSETFKVSESRMVRVAVRRGTDGQLFSQVVADAGVDLADPDTADKVDAAEARVRSASGLPL